MKSRVVLVVITLLTMVFLFFALHFIWSSVQAPVVDLVFSSQGMCELRTYKVPTQFQDDARNWVMTHDVEPISVKATSC